MESIVNTRLPSVLSFAIETCICDGDPIKLNQDRWASALLPATQPPAVFLEVYPRDGDYLLLTWLKAVDGKPLLLSLRDQKFVVEGREDVKIETSEAQVAAVLEYHSLSMELLCAILRGGNATPRSLVATHSRRLGLESPHLVTMVSNDEVTTLIRRPQPLPRNLIPSSRMLLSTRRSQKAEARGRCLFASGGWRFTGLTWLGRAASCPLLCERGMRSARSPVDPARLALSR